MTETATKGMDSIRAEAIARVAHEANRAYCKTIGDDSQNSWDEAPEWQKNSAVDGVVFHSVHPDSEPQDSHYNWLAGKRRDGWKYGRVKDEGKKEHPCIVPYSQLPEEQKAKDRLFVAVVRALL